MNVHAAACVRLVPFRHERHAQPLLERDLLSGLLEDGSTVGHHVQIGVTDVDLRLARAPFALAKLNRDARLAQVGPDSRQQRLGFRTLEHMIIFDVGAEGAQVVIVFLARGLVAVAEDEELQLTGALGAQTCRARSLDLVP